MKRFRLSLLLIVLMSMVGVKAATVDDLVLLDQNYVLVCDELGARPGSGVLFGDNHFLDVKGGQVNDTSKGVVDLSVVDGVIVTQELADKYGSYGSHKNFLRIKQGQEVISFKIAAGAKVIIFENNNNKYDSDGNPERYPVIYADAELSTPLSDVSNVVAAQESIARFEWIADETRTVWLSTYGTDQYISYIIIEDSNTASPLELFTISGDYPNEWAVTLNGLPFSSMSKRYFPEGSNVTLQVNHGNPYRLTSVTNNGNVLEQGDDLPNPYTYEFTQISGDYDIAFGYKEVPKLYVDYDTERGTVKVNDKVWTGEENQQEVGKEVKLTIEPKEGYVITNVDINGEDHTEDVLNNGGVYTFTMPSEVVHVYVDFAEPGKANLYVYYDTEQGTVKVNDKVWTGEETQQEVGKEVKLTIEPKEGYGIVELRVNDEDKSAEVNYDGGDYIFTMPNEDVSVDVRFAELNSSYAVVNGIRYNFSGTNAEVTNEGGYTVYRDSIIIPETVTYLGTTYTVTSIGKGAFSGCYYLTKVTIPNTVTSIGDQAFNMCQGLTTVIIPNSVTSIGSSAFSGCNLTSLEIPSSVTSMGWRAFADCTVEQLTVSCNIPSADGSLFENLSVGELIIGNGVTSIGDNAFRRLRGGTKSIYIPNSVTSIGKMAFRISGEGCKLTVNCNIPSVSSESGDNSPFGGSEFNELIIGDDVTSIGDGAFTSCSIKSITFGNSLTNIGVGAFAGCSIKSITFGNSLTNIGVGAFQWLRELTSLNIPNTVTSIGSNAFSHCRDLTSVTFRNSLVSIGDEAFQDCTGLTSIDIPGSVTNIGDGAFSFCI